MTARERLLQFAKELADPDWSLSVPHVAKQTIGKLVAIIEAKPRTITTIEELDELPEGSVILAERTGDSYQKNHEDEWFIWGGGGREPEDVDLPATVLHEPQP